MQREAAVTGYVERRERLTSALRAGVGQVGLAKRTSNLFRDRTAITKHRLDVRDFHHVLEVNPIEGWLDAEGMADYETIVAAVLEHGVMPAVVPELKSITIGGAAAGVGIEATSFRHGLVHETLLEMDILLADGTVVLARPDNEHADLFYGFANSYGTLGYALRLRARTVPVKPFVQVNRTHYDNAIDFFYALARACESHRDFVDGVVFDRQTLYLNTARFVDTAPATSDYTYRDIYYQSIRTKPRDFLSVQDYIWRWDTDWFWCSKQVGAQNPLLRRLFGRSRLGSRTYQRIMRVNSALGLTRAIDRVLRRSAESVIQDVDIPIEHAAQFLDRFLGRVGITPVWICPIRPSPQAARFKLFPMTPGHLYINFGFWDVVHSREARAPGYLNRFIEDEVTRLGGIKSLYSDSYYSPQAFWSIYDHAAYQSLKRRYDPRGRLGDLYAKCVLRH